MVAGRGGGWIKRRGKENDKEKRQMRQKKNKRERARERERGKTKAKTSGRESWRQEASHPQNKRLSVTHFQQCIQVVRAAYA